jgi:hypothetical protein
MTTQPKCLYCGATSQEAPLINVTYKDQQINICSQHLPLLIHEPQKLTESLARASGE